MIYLNIDGMYGNGAYEKPEYKTICDLIANMDRLGVWASVTAHAEGRDLNPLYGNRKLIEDIVKAGVGDRIIPSFAVSPAMLYVLEEFEHLRQHLESGDVQFISVYPRTNRHSVHEIERLLSLVACYTPVILIYADELQKSDYVGLTSLANTFPQLNFIIQNAVWWDFSAAADLMWRCRNVHIDNAGLHFRDAIKSVTRLIGKGRAVFGLGPSVYNGASMASLCYSGIDAAEKEAIASGNLLSMISSKKILDRFITGSKNIRPKVGNKFWGLFIEGKGVSDTLVIDAHTHIGPMARGWYMPGADIDLQLADMEKDMNRLGITQIISNPEPALFGDPIEGSILVEDKVKDRGERFKGYLPFNPHYADIMTDSAIEGFFKRKYYIGFKIIPEYWRVRINDPVFEPVWKYAGKHHLPTLIHTWEGEYGTAEMIKKVAAAHPDAIYILGHSGGSTKGREEAISAVNTYSNIYLEFCGSFTAKQKWEDTLKHVDKNRILFGSDTYPHEIAWEMGRLLSSEIDDNTLKLILGRNMQQILNMRI